MSSNSRIRNAAQQLRLKFDANGSILSAAHLVEIACESEGLKIYPLSIDDPLLAGSLALLDRDTQTILYRNTLTKSAKCFSVAHELAHWWLHSGSVSCSENSFPDDELRDNPEERLVGYSPQQRMESEANAFAAEFLLPVPILVKWLTAGKTIEEITAQTGLSPFLIRAQTIETLLYSQETSIANETPSQLSTNRLRLDDSQRRAAEIASGPVLVEAGPGTGKTSTLVGRVTHLLETGVQPTEILALTYSQKAAGEMTERLTRQHGAIAGQIWIGTLHAFALDLIRRFGEEVGMVPNPTLITPLQATDLMSRKIHRFELKAHEYLHNPAYPVRTFLSAISRAKDGLCSPESYLESAVAEIVVPDDENSIIRKEKRIEIARVYAEWQRILSETGCMDFGDLIFCAVELLRNNPQIRRQIQSEYKHILVDEYQDINRATAELVKLVAGSGEGLWVVGDLRQAIYKFIGASPTNLTGFESDFPGATRLALEVNYRSKQEIIDLFANLVDPVSPPHWTASRGASTAAIEFNTADTPTAELAGIVEEIKLITNVEYNSSDIAILCRSNRKADEYAAALQHSSIPVQRVQPLFDHPTVLALLALMSIITEKRGPGLWRIGRTAPYLATTESIQAVLNHATLNDSSVLDSLAHSLDSGLQLLYTHLNDWQEFSNPVEFLFHWMISSDMGLQQILTDKSESAEQKRAAVYGLLNFAEEVVTLLGATEPTNLATFLQLVRCAKAGGDDSRLPSTSSVGVHLLTVHKSKGLEFPVVFLPSLNAGVFPPYKRGVNSEAPGDDSEDEEPDGVEEQRVFFVALSRAKDRLILSHYHSKGGKPIKSSPLLEPLASHLEGPNISQKHWFIEEPTIHAPETLASQTPLSYRASELEIIWTCPRKFYYSHILRLPNQETGPPVYLAFRQVLRDMHNWLEEEARSNLSPDSATIAARLEECWNSQTIEESAYLNLLKRRSAEAITNLPIGVPAGDRPLPPLHVTLPSGEVRMTAEFGAISDDGGVVIEKNKFGKFDKSAGNEPRLALIRKAVKQMLGEETPITIHVRFPLLDQEVLSKESARWEPSRIEKYENSLKVIASGQFEINPSPKSCSECAFFFICPT